MSVFSATVRFFGSIAGVDCGGLTPVTVLVVTGRVAVFPWDCGRGGRLGRTDNVWTWMVVVEMAVVLPPDITTVGTPPPGAAPPGAGAPRDATPSRGAAVPPPATPPPGATIPLGVAAVPGTTVPAGGATSGPLGVAKLVAIIGVETVPGLVGVAGLVAIIGVEMGTPPPGGAVPPGLVGVAEIVALVGVETDTPPPTVPVTLEIPGPVGMAGVKVTLGNPVCPPLGVRVTFAKLIPVVTESLEV